MDCSLCKCTVERELWDLHTGIQCPQRMLACQYCEFELPAIDLLEHQVWTYVTSLETNFRYNSLCSDYYVGGWHRMYVEIEQSIVKLAGSTSDFVNGLDMNSSSIRDQIQGNILTDAGHSSQSSRKLTFKLLLLITVNFNI